MRRDGQNSRTAHRTREIGYVPLGIERAWIRRRDAKGDVMKSTENRRKSKVKNLTPHRTEDVKGGRDAE